MADDPGNVPAPRRDWETSNQQLATTNGGIASATAENTAHHLRPDAPEPPIVNATDQPSVNATTHAVTDTTNELITASTERWNLSGRIASSLFAI
jgi:hypothetical protein